jgi:porin
MHATLTTLLALTLATCAVAPAHAASDDYTASHLFGGWGGVRQTLHDDGIDLDLNYVGEFAYNRSGGTRHADAYADQIHVGVDLDFDKLWGWHGASFHLAINQRNGDQLDHKAQIGNLFETQEIHGRGHVARLSNFFYEQSLWNNLVDLRIGRMVPGGGGAQFMAFDCEFQNLAACGSLPGYVSNGWYTSPIGQYGAAVTIKPSSSWYVRVGALDSNPRNLENAQGLNPLTPGGWKNTLALGELGWNTTMGAADLPGTWAIGGWHNSANYPDVLLASNGRPLADAGSDAQPLIRNSESGSYVMLRQQLTRNPQAGGLTVFANLVQSDADTDRVDELLQVGLLYDAPFAGRTHDRAGLMLSRAQVNGRVADGIRLDKLTNAEPRALPGNEYTLELNYKLAVLSGVYLMPNVQYIRHPGGSDDNRDAAVLGMRIAADF